MSSEPPSPRNASSPRGPATSPSTPAVAHLESIDTRNQASGVVGSTPTSGCPTRGSAPGLQPLRPQPSCQAQGPIGGQKTVRGVRASRTCCLLVRVRSKVASSTRSGICGGAASSSHLLIEFVEPFVCGHHAVLFWATAGCRASAWSAARIASVA